MKYRPLTYWVAGFFLTLVLAAVLLAALHTGTFDLSVGEVLTALVSKDDPHRAVVLDLRLSRALLGFTAGAVLTLSGFFMQALIKNPLADPYIMGLTAGAGFGVNLVILGLIPLSLATWFTYPLFAALGAALSLLLLLILGWRSFMEDNAKLLIAGVAVSAIFTAVTGFLIYTQADSDQVRQIVFWAFGSLSRSTWPAVSVSAIMLFLAVGFGWLLASRLDVLVLGDKQARSLGMNVRTLKFGLLILSSVTVGGVVAFTGPIGFVGMMVPHFCRSFFGAAHRPNVLLGALLGGTFLLACDVLTRWILPPAGLPIGIITAILGVPFFLYVLFAKRSYL